jgi:hypothetical protein
MLINETSRISQLTDAGKAKYNALMAEAGLSIDDLYDEIVSKISALSVEEKFAAINWYSDAHRFAFETAIRHNVTPEQVAGVISAVSPRMPWLRNKSVAEKVVATFRNYSELSATEAASAMGLGLVSNFAMAIKIARGESIADTLTGTKRRSFYNNIVAPYGSDSVTIDTWMVRAIMNTAGKSLKVATDMLRKNETALGGTGFGYYALAEVCRKVAMQPGNGLITAAQIQALYWVAVSGSQNGGRTDIGQ